MAVVCLHVSAALYFLIGAGLALFMMMSERQSGVAIAFAIGFLVFCLALVAGIEFVAAGLKKRKFWAWIAGLCIFATYLPSAFLPLGAFGLWGLLDSGTQREFGVGSKANSVG
jgi:hypothetical protein